MKQQTLYRGETKKAKPTKAEKIAAHFARVKRRQEGNKKKEATA